MASVLLLVAGSEGAALPLLAHLVGPSGPLRDATRPDLLPVLEVLNLLWVGPLLPLSKNLACCRALARPMYHRPLHDCMIA